MTLVLLIIAATGLAGFGIVAFVRYEANGDQARRNAEFAEQGFDLLARYNEEVAHGLVHHPDYQRRMAAAQVRYDKWKQTQQVGRPDVT